MIDDHNAWLKRMGVSTKAPRKPKGIYDLPDLSTGRVNTSDTIGNGYVKRQHKYSGDNTICIGQAYNKGNYVVLSINEAKDPATGKRR